ncbi:hypothetical protein DEU56DRAFT_905628 [Suillus clintonianus]|uniref:uncharacterized protein n=1 Tax=Suillus clintonianus TaxID=1904413 RepID=UPI001B86F892|nr:uncharacterized protein DEU56DRAFT_905628 [Suillus clintonianus]KAG2109514.1 hypothetical protein DEU56DRAFT_905628 [Suillus clintonianus]
MPCPPLSFLLIVLICPLPVLPARPLLLLHARARLVMSSLQQKDLAFLSRFALRQSAIGLVTDCESCGGSVPITICRSDKNGNEGKPMAMPTASTSSSDAFSTTFPSTQPSTSSHPQQNNKKPRKRGGRCIGPFCRRASALRCPQGMCLSHCTDSGGCPIHGMEAHNQRVDVQPVDDNSVFYLEDAETREPVFDTDDTETGYGYRDLQQALEASMTATGGHPAPFASFHDLLTAPNPSQLPAPSPTQTPSRICTPPPSFFPPQQRDDTVLTTRAFPVHKLSKAPRVTDQLDPLWAGDLNARAQEEISSKMVSERRKEMERAAKQRFVLYWFDADDAPVIMQWVTHCPFFPQYQLSDDPTLLQSLGDDIQKIDVFEASFMRWIPSVLTHTFTLDSGCHVFIRRHSVTECADFDGLFKSSKLLNRPSHARFNIKGERDGVRWKKKQPQTASSDVEIVDDVQLTPKRSLGKRRWNPSPGQETPTPTRARFDLQEDDFNYRRATSLSLTPPYLPTQSQSYADLEGDDFDSRRATSLSPTPPLITTTPPLITTKPTSQPAHQADDFDSRRAASLSPTPPLVTTKPTSQPAHPSKIQQPAPPSIIPVHVPVYNPAKRQGWPHAMYTLDMTVGFQQMDNVNLRVHYSQEQLFSLVFGGAPFVRATYHQNRKAWRETEMTILEMHKRAGRTPDGLW